jgi:hypothetical protein
MPTENEPITAEKMRNRKFVAILGTCQDCGEPVTERQEFLRSDDGIRHALCVYDRAYAKHVRDLKSKMGQ